MVNFVLLGWIGAVNLSLLLVITKSLTSVTVRKRILLHILLIFAVAVDIPMYISFIVIGYYGTWTYSFHKLEPAFLLGAYSMTISDWGSVLYDIQEMKHTPLIFRRNALIIINVVFSTICVSNFVAVNVLSDMDRFTKSPLYVIMIYLQVIAELSLTAMMLSAGLRLSRRIRGVSGMLNSASNSTSSMHASLLGSRPIMNGPATCTAAGSCSNSQSGVVIRHGGSMGFQAALNKLIGVMATCVCCISIQLLLLFLNYIMGYERDPEKSVGPELFYWIFYAWLPLWGPTLALLYLTRSRAAKRSESPSQGSTPRPTDWSGNSAGNMPRYSSLITPSADKGCCDAIEELSTEATTPNPPSPYINTRKGHSGSVTSGSKHSSMMTSSPAASMTPSPATLHPGLIYRPPDYPSVLFSTKEGMSDEESQEEEEFGMSGRTTSASLMGAGLYGSSGIGDLTPTDSYRDDDGGAGGEGHGNWMYPTSDIESSIEEDPDGTPPPSIFAPNMSSMSSSHNQLTRISSVGTGGGSFTANDDTVTAATAAAAAIKSGRKGRSRRSIATNET